MCTVTWAGHASGYTLWFNRDEQRTRPPAEPPRLQQRDGVAVLAPRDPAGGGTWLAVNAHGLTVGLLNYYAAGHAAPSGRPRSRGLLVADLIALPTAQAVWARADALDRSAYPPFILLVLGPDGTAGAGWWDGVRWERRALDYADRPITTSSYRSAEVVARRREQFRGMEAGGDLRAYHTSRDALGDAFSVWMSRPDAHTVSLSQITVDPAQVQFAYSARGPDDRPGPQVVLALPRG